MYLLPQTVLPSFSMMLWSGGLWKAVIEKRSKEDVQKGAELAPEPAGCSRPGNFFKNSIFIFCSFSASSNCSLIIWILASLFLKAASRSCVAQLKSNGSSSCPWASFFLAFIRRVCSGVMTTASSCWTRWETLGLISCVPEVFEDALRGFFLVEVLSLMQRLWPLLQPKQL